VLDHDHGVGTRWKRSARHDASRLASFNGSLGPTAGDHCLDDLQVAHAGLHVAGADGKPIHYRFVVRRRINIRANIFAQAATDCLIQSNIFG